MKDEIDEFQHLLDNNKPTKMNGLMTTHHIFSLNDKILYRALSCHCQGSENLCRCFNPKEVNRVPVQMGGQLEQQVPLVETPREEPIQLVEAPLRIHDWVAVEYGNRWYLGQVQEILDKESVKISYMKEKNENAFSWPNPPDIDTINSGTILCNTAIPIILRENRRFQTFYLPDYDRVCGIFNQTF
jgi:hypothetical protein